MPTFRYHCLGVSVRLLRTERSRWKPQESSNRSYSGSAKANRFTLILDAIASAASSGIERHRAASSGIERDRAASSGTERHRAASSDIERHRAASSGIERHRVRGALASVKTIDVGNFGCSKSSASSGIERHRATSSDIERHRAASSGIERLRR